MEVTLTNVARTAEFIGQLESPQTVEVRARIEAFVESILFKEGTDVKAGDPLFLLDSKPFQERLDAAKGALAEARAALKKNQADVARLVPLAKLKAVPQQDLDNALASVDVAEANVLSAEARVKSADLELGYCDIRAPVPGRIGAKQVSIGSLVGKGQPTLLATVSQLDPIWFSCAISDADYMRAERTAKDHGRQLGELPVTLIRADDREHPHPGQWVFLDSTVDVTTATIRARALFPNPDQVLRPGMFARIRLSLRTEAGSLLVPERALAELQGKSYVWVVGADQKTTRRDVQVAAAKVGASVVVEEGLKPGERIVVEGLQKVHDGAVVKPLTAAEWAELVTAQATQSGRAGGAPRHRE